jgi:hypothetical protein
MHIESLPAKTRALLESLRDIQDIGNFLLVGGTALALHAAHRVSEDLDFAFVGGSKLPRDNVSSITGALKAKGLDTRFIDRPDAAIEFSESLLDLEDYQQDYVAGDVKMTFFAHDEYETLFKEPSGRLSAGNVKIASLSEIFDSKAILFSRYCRSRDVFDLWWMIEHGGIGTGRIAEVFAKTAQSHNLATAFARIHEQKYAYTDPGYERLDAALPDRDEARRLLNAKIQAWIERQAVETLRALRLSQ